MAGVVSVVCASVVSGMRTDGVSVGSTDSTVGADGVDGAVVAGRSDGAAHPAAHTAPISKTKMAETKARNGVQIL